MSLRPGVTPRSSAAHADPSEVFSGSQRRGTLRVISDDESVIFGRRWDAEG